MRAEECGVAENLEKTLLCKFLFWWAKFYLYNNVGFHVKSNIEPSILMTDT